MKKTSVSRSRLRDGLAGLLALAMACAGCVLHVHLLTVEAGGQRPATSAPASRPSGPSALDPTTGDLVRRLMESLQ